MVASQMQKSTAGKFQDEAPIRHQILKLPNCSKPFTPVFGSANARTAIRYLGRDSDAQVAASPGPTAEANASHGILLVLLVWRV
jgi:hypothetical protein